MHLIWQRCERWRCICKSAWQCFLSNTHITGLLFHTFIPQSFLSTSYIFIPQSFLPSFYIDTTVLPFSVHASHSYSPHTLTHSVQQPACISITRASGTMVGSQLCISRPDHAEIELAKKDFRDLLKPELVPHALLLCSMKDYDREALIEAAKHLSIIPLEQRSALMTVVSDWRDRNTSDNNSASTSLRNTRLSHASATSATSTLPSSVDSRRTSSRQSYGIYSPANDSPFDYSAHHRLSFPHSVPGNSTPTVAFDTPVSGPPHFQATPFTHQVANEAINNESPLSQQSSGCPPTSLSEKIKEKFKKKTQTPSKAKWVCSVCCKICARSETMREHTKSQCLNPKTYQCLSCAYSDRKPKAIIKHCKEHDPDRGYKVYTPPARNVHASSLTGELHFSEEELLDATHQHCLQSKDVPPSDANNRLKALLRALLAGADGQQMEQEMNELYLVLRIEPMSWLELTWRKEDAIRLSDMASYSLQYDEASTSSNSGDICLKFVASGLEQHKHGITNLSDYAADLMRSAVGIQWPTTLAQQSELPHPPNVAAARHPTTTMPQHFTARDEPFAFDAQAQEFAMSEPPRNNHHDSLNGQTHHQGYTRLQASTQQDHDSHFGRSSNRPNSVVMQDWSFPNNYIFKEDQANSGH